MADHNGSSPEQRAKRLLGNHLHNQLGIRCRMWHQQLDAQDDQVSNDRTAERYTQVVVPPNGCRDEPPGNSRPPLRSAAS